ncbi:MAG: folate family ECF transporter S component [Clostridia bacterium]|nr:folate family ECF transporter S component [Clostridia bacterium]MBQ6614698.1 folate family ECF transporter S component [Clostridia bacterium]
MNIKLTPKIIARLAVLAAISIILGKFLSIKIEPWGRISLENLTVIISGFAYGPLAGVLCGVVADLLGCLVYGYAINPIITLGAAAVGLFAGLFGQKGVLEKERLWLSVLSAHTVGSCIIKSIGIYVFYSTPPETLMLRIPFYVISGTLEFLIISVLFRSRATRKIF